MSRSTVASSRLLTTLMREHERILAVLAALQDFSHLHAGDDPQARAALRLFVRFLRDYLDGWHHGKEEDLLFETLVRAGLPAEHGPVGCMRHEHTLGRQRVRELAALAEGDAPFSAAEQERLVELARAHAGVLVPHIAKENQALFPLAARLLPVELLAAIDDAADAVAERRGLTVGRELEALGDTLVARYHAAHVDVARAPARDLLR